MLKAALLFMTLVTLGSLGKANSRELNALIYNGPGTCAGCAESIGVRLKKLGFHVRYIGKNKQRGQIAKRLLTPRLHPDLYVQPGGSDILRETLEGMNRADQVAIRDFVKAGGHYLGICAGGYLAGETMLDEGKIIAGLDLIRCEVRDEDLTDAKPRLESILWFHGGRKATANRTENRDVYFQDGPRFCDRIDPRQKNFAYYRSNHVAALTVPLGRGSVGVIGPHPEADESWFNDDHLVPPAHLGYDLLDEVVFDLVPQIQSSRK